MCSAVGSKRGPAHFRPRECNERFGIHACACRAPCAETLRRGSCAEGCQHRRLSRRGARPTWRQRRRQVDSGQVHKRRSPARRRRDPSGRRSHLALFARRCAPGRHRDRLPGPRAVRQPHAGAELLLRPRNRLSEMAAPRHAAPQRSRYGARGRSDPRTAQGEAAEVRCPGGADVGRTAPGDRCRAGDGVCAQSRTSSTNPRLRLACASRARFST